MLINESLIRKLILESLNHNLMTEAGFHKNIKPGETSSMYGSEKEALILHSSKDVLNLGKFVLVMWPDKNTPNKIFKNLPGEAWTSMGIDYFREKGEDFSDVNWLLKNYYFPVTGKTWSDNDPRANGKAISKSDKLMKLLNTKDNVLSPGDFAAVSSNKILFRLAKSSFGIKNFSKKVKKAQLEERIRLANVKYAESKFDFKTKLAVQIGKETATGMYEDLISWSGPLLSVIELIPGAQPLIPFIEGLKKVTGVEDIRIKLNKNDFIGAGFAVVGLFPVVGNAISGAMEGIVSGIGTKTGATAAASLLSAINNYSQFDELMEKALKIFAGYVLGNEAYGTLENFVKGLFGDKYKDIGGANMNPGQVLPNLQKALKAIYEMFLVMAQFGKEGTEANFKQLSNAAGKIANFSAA